ncbi:Kinetochore protein Ndc80 [Trinorchestia longiramus]|nr:Kinetochore protein Ndc80 [Trinorchestia longiramus]
MSGWERSTAGSSRHNPSASSQSGGLITPGARSYGTNDGAGPRSFLPRPSSYGRAVEGSMRKMSATGASAGCVPPRRRSSVDDMALKARRSTARLSVMGVAGGAGGPSAAMLKATPIRNVLSVVNYAPPLSTQSKRMSSQSRQSNAGRHKRKDVRPINEASFKKHCVDNILNFLTDNNYCKQDCSLLNRRIITSPTNKDFASIFSFIYGMLVPNYKMPSRFDEEIPLKLKLLTYPSQIPKSTFASVGSPHSWPLLLAMLSWLCDIVSTVVTTPLQDMAYPSDFENAVNPYWKHLSLYLEAMRDTDPQHQLRCLMSYKEALEQDRCVDDEQRRQLEEEVALLAYEEPQLRQDQSNLHELQHSIVELKSDIEKLDGFNKNMKLTTDQLEIKKKKILHDLNGLQSRRQGIKDNAESLSALKASQNFTAEELLQVKNHAQTTAASLHQLQDQEKRTQEMIYAVQIKLCEAQVTRSKLIQQYDASPVASVVGVLTTVHQPSHGEYLHSHGQYLHSHGQYLHSHGKYLHSHGEYLHSLGEYLHSLGEYLHSLGEYLHSLGEYLHSLGEYLHSHDFMDTSDSDDAVPGGGVAAPVQEKDLQELASKLTEELRVARAKVVEAHATRSQMEEHCRHVDLQVEEKKLKMSQLKRQISSLEEDINYSQQEKKNEELAMLEKLNALQKEVSAARRASKPQLYTRQQQLLSLNQELEMKKLQLKRRADEGCASVQVMCAKINELLEFEEQLALEFTADVNNIITNAGQRDTGL